jgi:segregation and condensation protein A
VHLIRSGDEYKVKITDFEGPLDLLLHLIRESKLEIKTVKLGEVTAQYLEFLTNAGALNLDLASEFIEVGATLLEIKSRGILPKHDEGDEEEDIELRLRRQLEEYKILKEAAELLKPLENIDRFYKDPAQLKVKYEYVLDNLCMDDLVAAFTKIMYRAEKSNEVVEAKQIKLDRFTVADKIKDIRVRVGAGAVLKFSTLFDADHTKSEMINTFLALLELLKTQVVRAVQSERFGDIEIVKGEGYERNDSGNEDSD